MLETAAGKSDMEVADQLGTTRATVGKWRRRFLLDGCDGLLDEPRPGAPRTIGDDDVERVVVQTLESLPRDATQWSTRSMAKACGLSSATVSRIWRAFALKPHRSETFKLSRDPQFIEKVRDIVGLYLHPPERAVVMCVDEKPQIQALDRSQPVLPMRPGLPERRTHDYRRHGTTSLFAALDVATGEVLGKCYQRHRAVEFRNFLTVIAKAVPDDLEIHLVLDNYGTHKTAMIQIGWLANHASTCTSRPRAPPGSTKSNGGLLRLPSARSGAVRTAARRNWNRRSRSIWPSTTRTQSHSSGPRAPTRYSNHSRSTAKAFLIQDSRWRPAASRATRRQPGLGC